MPVVANDGDDGYDDEARRELDQTGACYVHASRRVFGCFESFGAFEHVEHGTIHGRG